MLSSEAGQAVSIGVDVVDRAEKGAFCVCKRPDGRLGRGGVKSGVEAWLPIALMCNVATCGTSS